MQEPSVELGGNGIWGGGTFLFEHAPLKIPVRHLGGKKDIGFSLEKFGRDSDLRVSEDF